MFARFGLKRLFSSASYGGVPKSGPSSLIKLGLGSVLVGSGLGLGVAFAKSADWDAVRKKLAENLDDSDYEDGSRGPLYVRLAWHLSGTYDKNSKTGGSNGATMRFNAEANHGANSGLHIARAFLEPIKKQFPEISYADLYTLAGAVAIEEMGGPKIAWRPGRVDAPHGSPCPPDGRLPDASQGAAHLRDIFYRMGLNDQEIVALAGAHSLGRMHVDRSGYDGPWTNAPTTFSNEFFRLLVEAKWHKRNWAGPEMYADDSNTLFMLPADICLIQDPQFRKHVEQYAKDEELFRKDFAAAFSKLLELGCELGSGSSTGFFARWFSK